MNGHRAVAGTGIVILLAAAAACGTDRADWYKGVQYEYESLAANIGEIQVAAAARDADKLKFECAAGLEDVVALQAATPYPDDRDTWDSMLDDLQLAFSACVAGDWTTTSTYLVSGAAKVNLLNDKLNG